MTPQRGEIRFITGPHHRRLVLITNAFDTYATVALLHSFEDMATDWDVLIGRSASAGTRYPLVVQLDLVATVAASLLGDVVGRVDVEAINDSAERGFALDGPFDGRWQFKREEGDELRWMQRQA